MSRLIKTAINEHIPANPGSPGSPYVPAQPERVVWEPRVECSYNYSTNVIVTESGTVVFMPGSSSYVCTTVYDLVYYPATAAVDAIPPSPPTPEQVNESLNRGWNTYARSVDPLVPGDYYECVVEPHTYAALLAVGRIGMEGSPIGSFKHGLMVDASGVYVFENGVVVAQLAALNAPGVPIRIGRLSDGRVVYQVGNQTRIGTAPPICDSYTTYVYSMLYSGYDEVSGPAFATAELASDIERSVLRAVGALAVSMPPRVVMAGGSSFTGLITLGVVMPAVSNLAVEVTDGSLIEVYLTGSSVLCAAMESVGRGSMTLKPVAVLGGDYDFPAIGSIELELLQFSTVEAAYVPAVPTFGYINLPVSTIWGEGGTEDAATASFSLPLLLTLAADVAYGVGSITLPGLYFSGSADWLSDDEMTLVSTGFGVSVMQPTIDLVLVLDSDGTLVSTMQLERVFIIELLSYLEQMSSLTALGEYNTQLLSVVRASMFTTYSAAGRPDIDDTSAVWVLNMDTSGSTRYEQYGFNSFFERNGSYFGVAADGIYELGGDTDAGLPIESVVHAGRSDLGYTHEKRIKDVYLGVSSTGELYLKVDTDEQVYVYSMRTSGTAMRHRPVPVGWGVSGYYWDFVLINPTGDDFKIESIEFTPIPIARRG